MSLPSLLSSRLMKPFLAVSPLERGALKVMDAPSAVAFTKKPSAGFKGRVSETSLTIRLSLASFIRKQPSATFVAAYEVTLCANGLPTRLKPFREPAASV